MFSAGLVHKRVLPLFLEHLHPLSRSVESFKKKNTNPQSFQINSIQVYTTHTCHSMRVIFIQKEYSIIPLFRYVFYITQMKSTKLFKEKNN